MPSSDRDDDRRQQLAVRPGEDGPRVPSSSAASDPAGARSAAVSSAASGARTRRPARRAAAGSPWRTARRLCSTSRTARSTTGRRTAVVDLEVDPAQAGQRVRRGRGPAGRRRAASRRSTGRRRRRGRSGSPARPAAARGRSCERSTSWTSSTSRCAQRARQRASRAGSARRPASARRTRSSKSSAPRAASGPLVGDEGPRRSVRRPGRRRRPPASTASSSLSREIAVSSRPSSAALTSGQSDRQDLGRSTRSERRRRRRRAGSPGRGRGTSGPGRAGRDAERRQRRVEPLAELLGGPLVEGDRRDRGRAAPRRRRARRSARRASSSCRDPAGATHRTGPGGAVAAARWSGVRRSSRVATDGWMAIRVEHGRRRSPARYAVPGAQRHATGTLSVDETLTGPGWSGAVRSGSIVLSPAIDVPGAVPQSRPPGDVPMTAAPRTPPPRPTTAALLALSVVVPVGDAAPDGGRSRPSAQTTNRSRSSVSTTSTDSSRPVRRRRAPAAGSAATTGRRRGVPRDPRPRAPRRRTRTRSSCRPVT